MTITLIIPILMILIGGFGLWYQNRKKYGKRNKKSVQLNSTSEKKDNLHFLYVLYTHFPFIKKEFNALKNRISILYPADKMSINREAIRFMNKSLAKSFILLGIFVVLSQGNLLYIMFGTFISAVLFKAGLANKLYEAENLLLKQFSTFLSDVIPVYREKQGQLDDALYSMLDKLPYFVGLHISKIHQILTSPHIESDVAAYTDSNPNQYIQSFLALAAPIQIYGDEDLKDGNTAFTQGVMDLQMQVEGESGTREVIATKFKSLPVIAIIPTFLIKGLQLFFIFFLPEAATYFDSVFGTIGEIIIFCTSYIIYSLIRSMIYSRKMEIKRNSIFKQIVNSSIINKFIPINEILNIQYRRHYTWMVRTEKQLISIGDHTGIKAHLLKSALIGIVAFITMNIVFATANIQTGSTLLNDFSDAFENAVVPDESYLQAMEQLAKFEVNEHKNDKKLDVVVLADEIRNQATVIKQDTYVDNVIEVVTKRINSIQKNYFQWWYEIIALFTAIIAALIPTITLNFMAKQSERGKENEVNSFNLLALTFINLEGIQIQTLLIWMERFAYYYKDAIQDCLINYQMSDEKALQDLYNYDDTVSYQRFIKSMAAVDEVGMKFAFANLEIQRASMAKSIERADEKYASESSAVGKMVAYIPAGVLTLFCLIGPIVAYSLNMWSSVSSIVGSNIGG